MGLISAAIGSASGVLADQWKEYFYCESISADTLVVKGKKRTSARSANTKGSDNIITNGSIIAVADGQCMIIVDNGKVADFCAVPGEYTYDMSTEPSLFDGGKLSTNIKNVFANIGKRFTYGGEAPKDQRVYYFNTKEILGNKYGTPNAVPFRVVDRNANIDMDINIKCFGEYSYKITNPILFYTNVCGNVASQYDRSELDSQLKSELLMHLQQAFSMIGEKGIRYSGLPGHTVELADALNEVLSAKWRDRRGIEIYSFGVNSVKADEEDEKRYKDLQATASLKDPSMRGAFMANSMGNAMQTAAGNTNGAMMGFAGMGMAMNSMGGMNLFGDQQYVQQQAAAPAAPANGWQCSCGATVTGNFCPQCGAKKPEPKITAGWKCSCGATATGNFCPECGAKKPADDGWTCSCGAVNKGKFCAQCGAKKPAGVPQYRCDKCGWEPEDKSNPPKFCPQCGDPFGDEDIVQ